MTAIVEAPFRQARNSAAFWAATGRSRGHEVIAGSGFLAVAGDQRAGLRVLIQDPAVAVDQIGDLVRGAPGPINIEDPFGTSDLTHLDLRHWQMPVMLRDPAPVAHPAMEVVRVHGGAATPDGAPVPGGASVPGGADLRAAERAVIAGFEMSRFEPYRAGEVFPAALLEEPGVDVFVARLDGVVAGACVTVVDAGIGSHYWVATPPEFRSRGVGRALMLGSLAHLAGIPVTLTASKLGRPLYESLGFTAVAMSTWWASR
ncbi:GNAT family N-acetyltransferase [Actinoplanes couchii]|uniref:N-acetyltransferase domain-containing protein n=1 Tax=Actinoplanes couchii TaxID=403638 RepID=A0ABQ3X6Z9_9ACTN|nr:GNAT family N-acetyltransferase [Actinoplanes couchii]MDR6322132.1 GNAT superfamily N-acetyltransferase [Actinoplanes couchii]GID54297.1 hypothetical protein Aco03nite_027010 [Actinoplanes couchii]